MDDPAAAALAGAFIGAVAAALDVLLVRADAPPPPDVVRAALVDAIASALGGQGCQGIGRKAAEPHGD